MSMSGPTRVLVHILLRVVFFFNDTATTEIYTLSLHDALPIYLGEGLAQVLAEPRPHLAVGDMEELEPRRARRARSEEHTSELQSHSDLVCRLLLDKKNTTFQGWVS